MKQVGALQRLSWVIWSPSRAFQALREKPVWLGAFLVIGLGNALCAWVTLSLFQNLALSPSFSSDQVQRIADFNRTVLYLSTGGAFLLTPISWLASALLVWLIVQVFECRIDFKAIFALLAHVQVSSLLSGLLVAAVLLLVSYRGGESADSATLMGNALSWKADVTPLVKIAFVNLNPFVLWYYGLLALGIRIVAKVSWRRAAAATGVFWVFCLAFGAAIAWVMNGLAGLGGSF